MEEHLCTKILYVSSHIPTFRIEVKFDIMGRVFYRK